MDERISLNLVSKYNAKMKRQIRKVLVFIDYAPSHPDLEFSNVKLKLLPTNTTSKSKPMDQGIIQTVKLKFRKRQLRHIISEMEKDKSKCGSEHLKNINILQAIYWINRPLQEVETSTIQKCFAKCGFRDFSRDESAFNDMSDSEEEDDDIPLKFISLARELFNCEYHLINNMYDKD